MSFVPERFEPTQEAKGSRGSPNEALAHALTPLIQITGKPLALQTLKGGFISLDIDSVHLLACCRFLRDQLGFHLLSSISGVDMLDHLEVVYHLRSLSRTQLLQLRVRTAYDSPQVESVVSIWPTANWHEREVYDLFGIHFSGHPDLRRILLDDEFEGHPLLKHFHQVPFSVKNPATTQVDPNMAVAGAFQQQGYERVAKKLVGQGMEERLHPGTPTFDHTRQEVQEPANVHTAPQEGEAASGKQEPGQQQPSTARKGEHDHGS